MSIDRRYFPQPKPLQDRLYRIEKEYADRNPLLFGYHRGTEDEKLDSLDDYIRIYRRKFPNVRIETIIEQAKELYEKSLLHPRTLYYNKDAWAYESPIQYE